MPRSKPPLFYIYLLGFLKKKEKFNLRHFRQIYLADLAQHLLSHKSTHCSGLHAVDA